MEKGQAGKWIVFAYGLPDHASPGEPVTGNAAQITANIRIDGGAANGVGDANPTELEDGYYVFDITGVESNGDLLLLAPASATAHVQVIAVPGAVWTVAPNSNALGIESDGDLTKANLCATTTTLTNKTGFSLAATGLDAIGQAATGVVEIAKAIWDRLLTGATHNIASSAGRRLRAIQEYQGYENGCVWVDTLNGTAGTVAWENGTVELNVLTWADALTIRAALGGAPRSHIANGSTIQLSANSDKYTLLGEEWSLDLNSQSIAQMFATHASIYGIGTGSGYRFFFSKLAISAALTLGPGGMKECALGANVITLGTAGTYLLDGCFPAGSATPIIDFGTTAATSTTVIMTHYHGPVEIRNLGNAGTDVLTIVGGGHVTFAASCVGGTANLYGTFEKTNNGSGITINEDARIDAAQLLAWLTDDSTKIDGSQLNTASGAVGSDGTGLSEAGGTGNHLTDLGGMSTGMKGEVNSEVDGALNTAIPGAPTADSVNERVKALDVLLEALGAGDAAAIKAKTDGLEFTGTDVKATLDGEEVTTDSASRTASKADVSALALEATLTAMKGSGFAGATDSLEAIRNRGDAEWITATGFSTHDAAAVKTAIEAAGGHLALIKAVTDVIPDAGAMTAIGTDTARLTAVRAAVLTDWINDGRLDVLLDAIKAVTDALGTTAAGNLKLSGESIVTGTINTGITAASLTTFSASDIITAADDHYNGRIIVFTSGTLKYQMTDIGDYAIVSAEGGFTVTALTSIPLDGVTFIIL